MQVGAAELQAPLEVGGGLAALLPVRGHGEEPPFQARGHLAAIAIAAGGRAVELRERMGQQGARLGQRAAAPCIARGLLVRRGRLVESLGLLVVGGHQPPVRVAARTSDEGVGHLGVQHRAHARGRQLSGDLAQQLMAKPPIVVSRRLEHKGVLEFVDDVVDLVVAQVDHRAQETAIHLAADDGGGLQHRHYVGSGAQPGEQRLVQRLRHAGLTESGHELFDVERHSVAAAGYRRRDRQRTGPD